MASNITNKSLEIINNVLTKIYVVGEKAFESRYVSKFIKTIDSRLFRVVVSPLPVLFADVGAGMSLDKWLQNPNLSTSSILLGNLASLAIWGIYAVKTGKNTRFVDFSFLKRRKRQGILKAIEEGDLEKIKATKGIKNWNWKAFKNWSVSGPDTKPISPLDYAVEKEQWMIVQWLLSKDATPIYPIMSDDPVKMYQDMAKMSKKQNKNHLEKMKTWNTLILDGPTFVMAEAYRNKQRHAPSPKENLFLEICTDLFKSITINSSPEKAILFFSQNHDLFDLNLIRTIIPQMLEIEGNPNTAEFFRVMMAHIEKEDLESNIENSNKNTKEINTKKRL